MARKTNTGQKQAKPKPPARRLTKQQKLWAKYYVIDWNGSSAAVQAGYAKSGAEARGYGNSHNTLVMEYVATLVAKINNRLNIDADYVRQRLVEIDTLDVIDILDDDCSLLPFGKWPKAWRTSINGIEVSTLQNSDLETIIKKIKWPDKLRNLELLGKHISVKAWDRDPTIDAGSPPPLQITFESSKSIGDIRITNAKT